MMPCHIFINNLALNVFVTSVVITTYHRRTCNQLNSYQENLLLTPTMKKMAIKSNIYPSKFQDTLKFRTVRCTNI